MDLSVRADESTARNAVRRRLCALALAAACALPCAADAVTLDWLLQRPLECLLRMTITDVQSCRSEHACSDRPAAPDA
jgi:hypothetical protein